MRRVCCFGRRRCQRTDARDHHRGCEAGRDACGDLKRSGAAWDFALGTVGKLNSNLLCAHALQDTSSGGGLEIRVDVGAARAVLRRERRKEGVTPILTYDQLLSASPELYAVWLECSTAVFLRRISPLALAHTWPLQMPIRGATATTINA